MPKLVLCLRDSADYTTLKCSLGAPSQPQLNGAGDTRRSEEGRDNNDDEEAVIVMKIIIHAIVVMLVVTAW